MVDKRSAPAFSIGHSKSNSKHPTDTFPGPGSYEAPSTIKSNKSSNNAYFHSYQTGLHNLAFENTQIPFQVQEPIILLSP
jgi:hypothetical protein